MKHAIALFSVVTVGGMIIGTVVLTFVAGIYFSIVRLAG
jgi:hypothetical protein